MSNKLFNFRLRTADPDDAEIQAYLDDEMNKDYEKSALIRSLLLTGIRARLGKKYEDWRDNQIRK